MNCGKAEKSFIPYVQGRLSAEDRDALDLHTSECTSCREALAKSAALWAAMDDDLAAPAFDVEGGLVDLKRRVAAEEQPAVSTASGFGNWLRWLVPAGAAAVAVLVVVLFQMQVFHQAPVPTKSKGAPPAKTVHPPQIALVDESALDTEEVDLVEFLEDMTLFENLDSFQEYDTLASMLDADDAEWEALLEEVSDEG